MQKYCPLLLWVMNIAFFMQPLFYVKDKKVNKEISNRDKDLKSKYLNLLFLFITFDAHCLYQYC